ncbi:MAG: glycosyltransferase family 39 protein [Sphingomonas sp.]
MAGLKALGGRKWALILTLLLLSALFLFVDRKTLPIILWDESRNIVNALEMKASGFSTVTLYEGNPDLWNTKPPLLIWLMTASISVFGPSEWALRLPSMIAMLGTVLMLALFVQRTTGSIVTAVTAGLLMVLSPAFFWEHGARTADYDSLLVFFTSAYLFLLFFVIHRARPSISALLLTGGAIGCAVLTKSVAGILPGLGVGLYMIFTNRLPRLWHGRFYWLAIAALVPIVLFLVVREAQSPGYLAAVWHNDLAGRLYTPVPGIGEKARWFYLSDLAAGYFSATPLLLLSPLLLLRLRGRSRLVLLYALTVSVVFLGVISVAASKLHHYLLPAIPFFAVAAAITLRAITVRMLEAFRSTAPGAKLFAVLLLLIGGLSVAAATRSAIGHRYFPASLPQGARTGLYGELFAALHDHGVTRLVVVDPGFVNEDMPHYAPVLRAYRLIWGASSMAIGQVRNLGALNPRDRGIVASCDEAVVATLGIHIRDIGGVPGCVAGRVQDSQVPAHGAGQAGP